MLRSFRRRTLFIVQLIVVSMMLASCTGAQDSAGPTATPISGNTSGAAVATSTTGTTGTTDTAPTAAPQGGTNVGPAPTMKNPDTIVEATSADAQTLDPAWLYDTNSWAIAFQVYESLIMLNREHTDQFVPMLATKWDISPDGKTYTFNIRKGVKFHEGQDLTPEDVAYSFWRGMMQDRASGPQWIVLQPILGLDVTSFQDVFVAKQNNNNWPAACEAAKKSVTFDNSAGTVTFHLKQPYGPFMPILTGPWGNVVSKSWVTSIGGWNGDCATAQKYHDPKVEADELFKVMNGTGPYKFVRWKPGEEIALTRNDNYWATEPIWQNGPSGPAKVKNILFKVITEWSTRFATFKAGDADTAVVDPQYISQVDPLVKETCAQDGNCTQTNSSGFLRMYKGLPSVASDAIFFTQQVNTTGGNSRLGSGKLDGNGVPPDFFSDLHVRKAFNYCFDNKTYIDDVWHGEAEQVLGPIINGELGYDASQPKYTLDLDKCAAEFKAAGLKSADGKSLWDTGFTVQYVYDTGTDSRKTVGEILRDNLQQVNPKFKLEISSEPWPAMLKELTDAKLPLYMIGWIEDFHDPHDWVFAFEGSTGAYATNQHFAPDLQTKLDALISQGIMETDANKRIPIYKQLQNMAYENALDIFLEQAQLRYYEQTWMKGFYYNSTYPGTTGSPGLYFYAMSKGQ